MMKFFIFTQLKITVNTMCLNLTIPKKRFYWLFILCVLFNSSITNGETHDDDSLSKINNYREYSPIFSSSGQVSSNDLNNVMKSGVKRIIYLAYNNQEKSLPNEDRLVRKLGMQYIHIPVEWSSPEINDFQLFAAVMQQNPSMPTLLHCQVNYRASVFSFLYRVIYLGVDMKEAKSDMNSIWKPNETWTKFIFQILEMNKIDPACDQCTW
jgi:protein tyrosine phosphatase (PTP) superfamily phosphohydrolase (DUF442 family)